MVVDRAGAAADGSVWHAWPRRRSYLERRVVSDARRARAQRAVGNRHPCRGTEPLARPVILHPAQLVGAAHRLASRSEEHTSELQSRENLVCRLLLEKKKR